MIYLYAPSMASITYIAKRKAWDEICVITNNQSIIKFCKNTEISYVILNQNDDLSLTGLKNYKRYIEEFALKFTNQEILFCFYGFDVFGLFLMKTLKETNTVYFSNLDHYYPKQKLITGLFTRAYRKTLFNWFIYSYILRTSLSIFKISRFRFFIGTTISDLDLEFIEYNQPIDSNIFLNNQKIVIKKYNIEDIDILFIDQGKSSFKTSDKLVNSILKHAADNQLNFTFKPHPTFPASNNLFLSEKLLPKELPIELLTGNVKLLIGIASAAFKSFSNNEAKVSVIDLVSWDDSKEKQKYKLTLDKDVHIIGSYDGLKEVISQNTSNC